MQTKKPHRAIILTYFVVISVLGSAHPAIGIAAAAADPALAPPAFAGLSRAQLSGVVIAQRSPLNCRARCGGNYSRCLRHVPGAPGAVRYCRSQLRACLSGCR